MVGIPLAGSLINREDAYFNKLISFCSACCVKRNSIQDLDPSGSDKYMYAIAF